MRDVVFAGLNRDDIAVLVFPDIEACRKLCPDLPANAAPATVVDDARVRGHFADLLDRLARSNPGSSMRVCRAILLDELPSMDKCEMTDKGSINQRAVLENRANLVAELYSRPLAPRVIAIED